MPAPGHHELFHVRLQAISGWFIRHPPCSHLVFLLRLQVDLLSPTTSPSNKVIAVFWGLAGFAVALALHVLQPG